MVTIERTGGSIDEGWEAIGLVMRVAEDGSTRGGYLVTKPKLDDKGNVVGRYSRVNDIIQTEELTRRSEAGQRQKLAGESAATMAAQTPEAGGIITVAADVLAAINGDRQESYPSAAPEEAESSQDREARVLAQFSEGDRQALSDFAYYARAKRDAQLNNEGERSSDLGRDIAAAYNRLSPEAKRQAYSVAKAIYGEDNVAF